MADGTGNVCLVACGRWGAEVLLRSPTIGMARHRTNLALANVKDQMPVRAPLALTRTLRDPANPYAPRKLEPRHLRKVVPWPARPPFS